MRVLAEFYIEDNQDIQATKMLALRDFLSDNSNDVNNFNLSTNQMSPECLSTLNDIIENCSESLTELTLSRCRIGSSHLNFFMYASPTNTF